MRWYYIVTGILFILSTIDFALAAPALVLVQEKRQARVDVMHVPKEETAVLGMRDEGLEKLGEKFFETGTHPSSSSAPSGPHHGSTDVVRPPAPNPANPNPPMGPPFSLSSSSTLSVQGLRARGNLLDKLEKFAALDLFDASWPEQLTYKRPHPSTLSDSSSDYMPPSDSDSDSESTSSSDWEYDPKYWRKPGDPPPRPLPDLKLLAKPPRRPPPPRLPLPSIKIGQYKVDPSNLPSTSGHGPGPPPTKPEHEVAQSPHQSLNADSQQPVDPQAALYAAKGKAKETRSISDTARDVGNGA